MARTIHSDMRGHLGNAHGLWIVNAKVGSGSTVIAGRANGRGIDMDHAYLDGKVFPDRDEATKAAATIETECGRCETYRKRGV